MKELQTLSRWWLGELAHQGVDLRSRLPQKVTDDIRAVYQPGEAEITAALPEPDALTRLTDSADSWAGVAAGARDGDGNKRPLIVTVPEALCLVRNATYPNVPASELRTIIGLELAATTPFSAANASWTFRRRDNGETDVIIVKRALIDRIRDHAETAGLILKEIRPASAGAKTPPFERFETPATRRARLWRKLNIGLAAALGLLIIATYGVSYARKSAALEDLQSRIAASTAEARDLRAALTQKEQAAEAVQQLQALKNDRSSVVESWARITRLLPESAWVSELMLTREGGSIVGFTATAAALIALLEQDPALKDVSFATAIRIDPISKAERFDIRFAHEGAEAAE
ncbi:PilN domain-containing protein [Labrenzia sp. OB1]|uniref:PilN domain-containing protein n=1 Tax=Labrenzia sp. OB1 TaxID=1561204 RepID=UPI0007B1BA4B|nr:PilN domain-containing protein [Labrenzia sp. OB1]KZM47465.1 hypothetical protein OA90_25690 [Labrenzia sp. OB1]